MGKRRRVGNIVKRSIIKNREEELKNELQKDQEEKKEERKSKIISQQ